METRIINGTNSNLKRGNPAWKKGVSGNPKGRKRKADCLISCIKDELTKLSENKVSTNEQLIAAALISKAKMGDLKAIELTLEYTNGRPAQALNLNSSGPILLKVIRDA